MKSVVGMTVGLVCVLITSAAFANGGASVRLRGATGLDVMFDGAEAKSVYEGLLKKKYREQCNQIDKHCEVITPIVACVKNGNGTYGCNFDVELTTGAVKASN